MDVAINQNGNKSPHSLSCAGLTSLVEGRGQGQEVGAEEGQLGVLRVVSKNRHQPAPGEVQVVTEEPNAQNMMSRPPQ